MNADGGALGSLAAGFLLIRHIGVTGTLCTAVLINGAVGLIALLISRNRRVLRFPVLSAIAENGEGMPDLRSHFGIVLILAISGFCAMAYEVIWTKLIALLAGPTTYSFTLVLFTFITGLALGSILFGWLSDRVKNPFLLLIATQLVAAVSARLVSQVMGNTQFYFAKLFYHFRDSFMTAAFFKGL